MADPITLAAGLGAAGLGYSMYRYGVRNTLKGLGYGALGAGAFGVGYASQNYDEHDVALVKDLLGFETDRDRFDPTGTTRSNESDSRFSGGRVREPRSTAVPTAAPSFLSGGQKFVSGAQNNMPGGWATSAARAGSEFMGQYGRYANQTAAIDLQSAAEHVFGQDQDDDEYPDAYVPSAGRVRGARSTTVPAFVSGVQNAMPGGWATSAARAGSAFMGQYGKYKNEGTEPLPRRDYRRTGPLSQLEQHVQQHHQNNP